MNESLEINSKIAIVHDWLPLVGGAERVIKELTSILPNSEIFTLFDFLSEDERIFVSNGRPVYTSGLNNLPGVKKYYRYLLSRCTMEVEKFDVSNYELVLSSSAALAKGVITSPYQKHISYVHSPARYAWDLSHEYISGISGIASTIKRKIAHNVMHNFRQWDLRTTNSVDVFLANSSFIQDRIWKYYRRESQVIYPPVDISSFNQGTKEREDFYLVVSRMVPYKKIPLIVECFANRRDLRLKVVGDGPDMAEIMKIATPNIEVLGHTSFPDLIDLMQRCKAFVFAALEDFGISPVEAQACGAPVICLGKGGTAETIRPLKSSNPTGIWFNEQSTSSILKAIDAFECDGDKISGKDCRDNAIRFGSENFKRSMLSVINDNL